MPGWSVDEYSIGYLLPEGPSITAELILVRDRAKSHHGLSRSSIIRRDQTTECRRPQRPGVSREDSVYSKAVSCIGERPWAYQCDEATALAERRRPTEGLSRLCPHRGRSTWTASVPQLTAAMWDAEYRFPERSGGGNACILPTWPASIIGDYGYEGR